MNPYLPHTDEEVSAMLREIGLSKIDDLFSDIPHAIKQKAPINLPSAKSEYEVLDHMNALAAMNIPGLSFLGGGSYDHFIPSVVGHILSRSEFYTAYTPYQPEISQGVLQAIFEFQTFICNVTGMEVSNAGLYDGHTAAYEAAVIALNSVRRTDKILYSAAIHPHTKEVLKAYFGGTGISCVEVAAEQGVTSPDDLKRKIDSNTAGVIFQSPNFFGYLENCDDLVGIIKETSALSILSANPLSLGILKSPGEWGVDIAIGDTQPLGLPSYFGGPSVGFISAREKYLRKLPGRIAGETIDREERRGYVLTLQAREQHIRRDKAASNICSNQALAALANSVYCALLGKDGIRSVALRNTANAHYLHDKLGEELSLRPLGDAPFFNEFTLVFPVNPEKLAASLQKKRIFPGIPLGKYYNEHSECMTIAVTEKRSREEMDLLVRTLSEELP